MNAANFREAVRTLARTPSFTLTVVLTLAVGIGANTAVFSVIDTVLLKPLPFPEADRLVWVSHADATTSVAVDIPPVRLRDWADRSASFESIAAYYTEDVPDTTGDRPENVRRATVTPGFFDLWRIAPALGRGFTAEEHRFGAQLPVLLSDRYWRARRGADSNVLGATLVIDGQLHPVIGVMPPSFSPVDDGVDLWTPHPVDAPWAQSRMAGWFDGVIGRLAPGVTAELGRADLAAVQGLLAEEYPDLDDNLVITAVPYKDLVVGDVGKSIWLVFGAVSMLLLIACTNIAALLLARAAHRVRDVAIRYSLGASRAAIAAYLSAETVVLVVAGAFAGFVAATTVVATANRLGLPRFDEIAIDGRTLAYTIASTVVVALLCGLFPAMRTARNSGSAMRSERTQISPRHTLNWLLVGVQISLSVTLLASAGLLLRSFQALAQVDPGFNAEQVLTFRQSGSFAETTNGFAGVVQRISRTIEELSALPGVEQVATSFAIPGVSEGLQIEIDIVEAQGIPEGRIVAEARTVSPSYFETLQIPLLSGNACRQSDVEAREVMVNRSFAERYFPDRSVIGLHLAGAAPDRIVGVVGDARELGTDREPVPTIYDCFNASNPFPWFFVRTSVEPTSIVAAIRQRLNELEPLRSVYDIASLDQRIGNIHAANRLRAMLLTFFSVTALALACLGIYGTLSYVVSLRRREVGVRVAIGALARDIVAHFLWQALRVVGISCLAGLALTFGFTRVLSTMLFGISPSDPLTLSAVVLLVVGATALAAILPAARAARIDPMQALREG